MEASLLAALESVDSDVDLGDPAQRREFRRQHSLVLAVVAAGGIIGSLIRYQLGLIWPTSAPEFPWTTLTINVTGAFVLGVLMVAISERWRGHPLARPFFGAGVLGGYTSFSAFAVDILLLIRADRPASAALYLVGTLAGALLGAAGGMVLARRTLGGASSRRTQQLSDRCALRRGDPCQQSRGTWVIGYLLVTAGAAVGAPLRHLTDRIVQGGRRSGFPWGTLTVSIVGSAALGALVAAAVLSGAQTRLEPCR